MPSPIDLTRRLIERVFPRGALTLSILTFAYFGLGLVRNRVLSNAYGANAEYEAYLAAFRIPEIAFDVVVAAGLTAPFVPIFTNLRDRDVVAAHRFGQTVLTAAVLVIAALSLVLVVMAPLTVEWIAPSFDAPTRELYVGLLRLSCLSQLFFAASFVLGEVLVAHRQFFFYALAPLFYTGGIIAGTVLLHGRIGVAGAAVGAVAGAFAHLVVRSIGIARTSFRPRPRLATGIGIGATTSYNYASDYQVVPVSLIGSAFSLAVFPSLSAAWNSGDGTAYRAILRRNVVTVAGLTIAAAAVLAVL